jgi:hypothetical protein
VVMESVIHLSRFVWHTGVSDAGNHDAIHVYCIYR